MIAGEEIVLTRRDYRDEISLGERWQLVRGSLPQLQRTKLDIHQSLPGGLFQVGTEIPLEKINTVDTRLLIGNRIKSLGCPTSPFIPYSFHFEEYQSKQADYGD